MNRRSSRALWIAALVAGVGFLYLARLGSLPPYLSIEEVTQARHAIALATTGRSLSGQRWPLYPAEPGYEAGWEPIGIYSTAALLKVAPFSETLVRLPSAIAGVLNVVLMFVLVRRVFRTDALALVAALVLATAPGHFLHSRIGTSQIITVTFQLAWLTLLVRFLDTRRTRDVFAATLSLGLGIYSYPAALIVVPLCAAGTLIVLMRYREPGGPGRWRSVPPAHLAGAAAGFGLALAPWAVWHVAHPERFRQLTEYYTHNSYNENLGLRSFSTIAGLSSHLDVWWNAFNPDPLLFSGDSSLRFSTREAGYLLLPIAVFLVVGALHLTRVVKPPVAFLIAAGLACAPLPAVIVTLYDFKRWLTILPFFTLAIVCGVRIMTSAGRRFQAVAAAGLLALAIVQFAGFVRDYWTDYPARSKFYYGGNIRGAVREALLTSPDPSCVFLDEEIRWLAEQWNLYSTVYGRTDPRIRPTFVHVGAEEIARIPCRQASLVVLDEEIRAKADVREALATHGWSGTPIREPDEAVYFSVFRRMADRGR